MKAKVAPWLWGSYPIGLSGETLVDLLESLGSPLPLSPPSSCKLILFLEKRQRTWFVDSDVSPASEAPPPGAGSDGSNPSLCYSLSLE